MADEDLDFVIDIRTTPRPFRIGDDRYELIPEIISSRYMTTFTKFHTAQGELAKKFKTKHEAEVGKDLYADIQAYNQEISLRVSRDPEYIDAVRENMKKLIAAFLEEDYKKPFIEKTYPDRVYTSLVEKVVSTYTGRPTESENASEA